MKDVITFCVVDQDDIEFLKDSALEAIIEGLLFTPAQSIESELNDKHPVTGMFTAEGAQSWYKNWLLGQLAERNKSPWA